MGSSPRRGNAGTGRDLLPRPEIGSGCVAGVPSWRGRFLYWGAGLQADKEGTSGGSPPLHRPRGPDAGRVALTAPTGGPCRFPQFHTSLAEQMRFFLAGKRVSAEDAPPDCSLGTRGSRLRPPEGARPECGVLLAAREPVGRRPRPGWVRGSWGAEPDLGRL